MKKIELEVVVECKCGGRLEARGSDIYTSSLYGQFQKEHKVCLLNPPETLTQLATDRAYDCARPGCDKKGIYNIWLCSDHVHRPAAEA